MEKRNKIIYWIATIWLALGMTATGLGQLLKSKTAQGGVDSMVNLGYPMYFLMIIGIWKILGVITILMPKLPIVKEWAYAGFFFAMSGAIISHLAAGNPVSEIFPGLLLLVLTVVSWYFRPVGRKIIAG